MTSPIARQLAMLEYIRDHQQANNLEIKQHLERVFGPVSRATVVRDINTLLDSELIARQGEGRSVVYTEAMQNRLLRYFDPAAYFATPPDKRTLRSERHDFEIFKDFDRIFSQEELQRLLGLNASYRERVRTLSQTILQKEIERLTIELSWKSSQLEGNTYSLIDTEVLIKEHKEARGHKREEAIMILNHKKALDYIWSRRSDFKDLSIRDIENVHSLLTADLGVLRGIRKKPVGITGTAYRPLDNEYQIREALETTVGIINSLRDPFSKTMAGIAMVSYIQPFEDGNKRTGRLLGNAILLAHDACPLSYRSVDEAEYKKAMILFYEQNSARLLKELFVQQYTFAAEHYFLA